MPADIPDYNFPDLTKRQNETLPTHATRHADGQAPNRANAFQQPSRTLSTDHHAAGQTSPQTRGQKMSSDLGPDIGAASLEFAFGDLKVLQEFANLQEPLSMRCRLSLAVHHLPRSLTQTLVWLAKAKRLDESRLSVKVIQETPDGRSGVKGVVRCRMSDGSKQTVVEGDPLDDPTQALKNTYFAVLRSCSESSGRGEREDEDEDQSSTTPRSG